MKSLKIFGALAASAVLTVSAGLSVNAASYSSSDIKSRTSVVAADSLGVSIEIEPEECYEGEPVFVNLKTSGGSGNYRYSFRVTDSIGTVVKSSESDKPSLELDLREGTYSISANVSDDQQRTGFDTVGLTVKKRNPLEDDGTGLSKDVLAPGDNLKISASFKGGKQPYTYQYSYYNKYSGSNSSTDFISKNSFTYSMPKTAGFYSFSVTAKDALGQTKTVSMDAAVVKDTGMKLDLSGSSVDKTSIAPGEVITTKNVAAGGTAPYKFHISYMAADGKWVYTDTEYIYGAERKFSIPKVSGKYTVRIAAKDYEGTYAEKRFGVEVLPFSVDTSKISEEVVDTDKQLTVTANSQNNVGRVRYRYSYHYQNSAWTYMGDYTSSATGRFSFSTPGVVYVRVGAKDGAGTYSEKQFRVIVRNPRPMDLSGTNVSSTVVAAGAKIRLDSRVSDANGNVKYHYSYHTEGKNWTYLGNYTTAPAKDFCFKWSNVYYIRVGVKDESGQYKEKQFRVIVKNPKPMDVSGTNVSSTVVAAGAKFRLNTKVSGANGKVKYHYSYHTEGKNWTYLGDYITASEKDFCFKWSNVYYVRVGVKDETGQYKEKQFRIIVKNPKPMDVSGTNISSTVVAAGTNFRLNSKVLRANGKVRYHYSYHTEGNDWVFLGDYTTAAVKDFCFKWNNVYYVRVGIKDETGQYKEKQFRVYVYSDKVRTTVEGTTLQSGASWKSKSLLDLGWGTKVNLIRENGRWILVRYGDKTGYIYNLAFGGSRNYSYISTSTLPVIADDIIYSRGKSIYNLYCYVNSMGYVSARNDSLENLCVYILRYRRGACYHRAALLYYLLDRAGYEVVRVYDGRDDYTGGSPHNWCIIKTSQGWRHIDPTPIIGLSKVYLDTDSRVGRIFSWDRNKYPKCN